MSLDDVRWPVRTARLTIRRGVAADAGATFAFRRLEQVGRWMTRWPTDREEYQRTFADPVRLADTLLVERGGTVIGDLMLRVEDAWSQAEAEAQARGVQAELGWCLDPSYQGQGYATEAVRALMRICFQDLGLRRVTADCFAANAASWQLMERVGMRREEHTIRDCLHRSGEWLDGLNYALLADEWMAQ